MFTGGECSVKCDHQDFPGLLNQLSACHLLQSKVLLTVLVGAGVPTKSGDAFVAVSAAADCNGRLSASVSFFGGL